MFHNLSTKSKLLSFPLFFMVFIIILGSIYNHYSDISNKRIKVATQTDVFIQNVLTGRISVYQFLRSPSDIKANKVRKDFQLLKTNVSVLKPKLSLKEDQKTCDEIIHLTNEYIYYFDAFAEKRIKEYQNEIQKESSEITSIISKMAKTGLILEEKLSKIHTSAGLLKNESQDTLTSTLVIVAIMAIIIFLSFSILLSNTIINSLQVFEEGLNQFFAYLNREATNVQLLKNNSNDEFGKMAKVVNANIEKTKISIDEDRKVIDDTILILTKFEKGDLSQRIDTRSSNPALTELIALLNEMASNIENNIDGVLEILNKYCKYNYMDKVDTQGITEHLLKLANGVNTLGDSITQMLIENKSNGLTLDRSSDILLQNVNVLNNNSNESAAALEETAAALEEITATVVRNNESINHMSDYAQQVTQSAKNGEELANKTTSAMDELSEQVNAISESIVLIDQIAFQTNILSLNAAVEAATAGEAGKGFAVVAQEVRNLASRSAEAAKDIKNIVENASKKADEGKQIAKKMFDGYEHLNANIVSTVDIINDVSAASKEQQSGIEQINDAIAELDKATQENAAVAANASNIAKETNSMAQSIVDNANQKEFTGKKDFDLTITSTSQKVMTQEISSKRTKQVLTDKTAVKKTSKIIASKNDTDEWESF